ncbi:MAG: hypothetical protein HOV80_06480 [Polyangiaceae bacterium]|nr:hypothetical protein [Polyangiaceae bacterium]
MKKISLTGSGPAKPAAAIAPATQEVLELFFNTGIAYHPLVLPAELPDMVASFVVMKDPQGGQVVSVRRAAPAEDPDVEISILEHVGALSRIWIPVPYQLSCPHAVQIYLAPGGGRRGSVKAILAIDTLEHPDTKGRFLDRKLDEGRPFRPLEREETGGFLDQPVIKEFVRKLERTGVDAAPFKLSALYEVLAPYLPRIRFSRIEMPAHASGQRSAQSSGLSHGAEPIDVSLVVDFGNSRTTAVLVEARDKGLFAIPLALRSTSDPFSVAEEAFDSRIAFLPSPFEDQTAPLGTGEGFTLPSIARLGREALDRALETPHRYTCSLSSPKRYLWADVQNDDRWYFAAKQQGEYRPIAGRLLKYLVEEGGGALLRQDGPSAPPEPRYAPRAMMLFAFTEILTQAYSQIASMEYRRFQGKEGNPRVLRHVVLTYPSAMRDEEKEVYETLVRNAATLVAYLLNIPEDRRPNSGEGDKFLFVDEAQAAQMVYLYQEVAETFSGSMEDFVKVYGDEAGKVRIASVDIGGGTTDVMIAEYADLLAGSGTSLTIQQLFQDGVNVAGDEVCRALVEEAIFPQILHQIESPSARAALIHLFAEGDAGHGASWRTLKAKLVPYFWLPLARCLWAVAEGFEIPGHSEGRTYGVDDIVTIFEGATFSTGVLAEVDKFLEQTAPGFPGLRNIFLKFDRQEIERVIQDVMREPLRRYADILAQFEVDILVLAGRASALKCVRDLFLSELPVTPPRIKSMSSYRVGDWYPSKWRHNGFIRDPKSTVTAGATVLHMAAKNRLAGFMLDRIEPAPQKPIVGLYQESEPHIGRASELFRDAETSAPVAYTSFMRLGFRNVDSPEMDATPLFEVLPASPDAERALLRERVSLVFSRDKKGQIHISDVKTQKGGASDGRSFTKDDFRLRLKTLTSDRYWLDTGVFRSIVRYL